jgi:bifunctional DNA-binding transcriptional regulator/antitoxin component of YhaV-PrlF toxin-antitoxin module
MRDTLTITSKGQTLLPVALRQKLGIGKKGGILPISFDEKTGKLIISPAKSLATLSERFSKYIPEGLEPLLDVDAYYQEHRT